jgi:hypothetical protein
MSHWGKTVCAACCSEDALSSQVEERGEEGECSCCGAKADQVLPMEDLIAYINERLRTEYSTADEEGLPWDQEEGKYFFDTFDIQDVFDIEIGGVPANNQELRDDIVGAFSDEVWCQKDAAALTRSEGLYSGWRHFCHTIKHGTRYLFFKSEPKPDDGDREFVPPAEMLAELAQLVRNFGLVRALKAGTRLYRVRWDPEGATYTSAAELGPPPEERAGQTRMSAAGIPMMYVATNIEAALAETVESQQGTASIATFEIVEEMRVLEVVKIRGVPSISRQGSEGVRENLKFLREFRKDISRPIVRDDNIHYEYTPTQVVTEYFRRAFKTIDDKHLEGIAFPSSRYPHGENVVLFLDRTNVLGVDDDLLSRHGRKCIKLIDVEHRVLA